MYSVSIIYRKNFQIRIRIHPNPRRFPNYSHRSRHHFSQAETSELTPPGPGEFPCNAKSQITQFLWELFASSVPFASWMIFFCKLGKRTAESGESDSIKQDVDLPIHPWNPENPVYVWKAMPAVSQKKIVPSDLLARDFSWTHWKLVAGFNISEKYDCQTGSFPQVRMNIFFDTTSHRQGKKTTTPPFFVAHTLSSPSPGSSVL